MDSEFYAIAKVVKMAERGCILASKKWMIELCRRLFKQNMKKLKSATCRCTGSTLKQTPRMFWALLSLS